MLDILRQGRHSLAMRARCMKTCCRMSRTGRDRCFGDQREAGARWRNHRTRGRKVRMIIRRSQEIIASNLAGEVARLPDTGNAILSLRTQVADYVLDPERLTLLCA